MEIPRVHKAVILFLFAALFAILAWQIQAPRLLWLRLFCLAAAAVCGFFGTVEALNYIVFVFDSRLRDHNEAKVYHQILLANAVRGLTGPQMDVLTRYGMVTAVGIIGQEEVNWLVRAPGGDLPLGFVQDFLELSAKTSPFLWPGREHQETNDGPN